MDKFNLNEERVMIFTGRFDYINSVLFIPMRRYRVKYVRWDEKRGWLWMKISTFRHSVTIPYTSWEAYYDNWKNINS